MRITKYELLFLKLNTKLECIKFTFIVARFFLLISKFIDIPSTTNLLRVQLPTKRVFHDR